MKQSQLNRISRKIVDGRTRTGKTTYTPRVMPVGTDYTILKLLVKVRSPKSKLVKNGKMLVLK